MTTRILVDQTFAVPRDDFTAGGTRIVRYDGKVQHDVDFVRFAAGQRYDAVCLLGDGHLLDPKLAELVRELSLVVVISVATNPLTAAERVRANAERITQAEASQLYRLLADGLHPAPRAL